MEVGQGGPEPSLRKRIKNRTLSCRRVLNLNRSLHRLRIIQQRRYASYPRSAIDWEMMISYSLLEETAMTPSTTSRIKSEGTYLTLILAILF